MVGLLILYPLWLWKQLKVTEAESRIVQLLEHTARTWLPSAFSPYFSLTLCFFSQLFTTSFQCGCFCGFWKLFCFQTDKHRNYNKVITNIEKQMTKTLRTNQYEAQCSLQQPHTVGSSSSFKVMQALVLCHKRKHNIKKYTWKTHIAPTSLQYDERCQRCLCFVFACSSAHCSQTENSWAEFLVSKGNSQVFSHTHCLSIC